MDKLELSLLIACAAAFVGTMTWSDYSKEKRIKALEAKVAEIQPGIGDQMGILSQHHTKLYLATRASNWDLARYELGEIGETLEQISAKLLRLDGRVQSLGPMVEALTPSIRAVNTALKAKKMDDFQTSYRQLTQACNTCHVKTATSYIIMKVPGTGEFTNMEFNLPKNQPSRP